MRFFRNRSFALANVASLFMFFGMFGSIFLLAQFFQTVQGYSPLGAGPADPAVDGDADLHRADRRRALRPHRRPAADRRRARAAGGRARAGSRRSRRRPSLQRRSSTPFIALRDRHGALLRAGRERRPRRVRPEEEGKASGANNAIRELGGVFGVAVLASVFAHFGGYGTGATFVDGMTPAVWVGAAVVALGALAAFAIPRLRRQGGAGACAGAGRTGPKRPALYSDERDGTRDVAASRGSRPQREPRRACGEQRATPASATRSSRRPTSWAIPPTTGGPTTKPR